VASDSKGVGEQSASNGLMAMTESSAQTQPSSGHKSRTGPLALVLTLILVAGGIGAFALWRSNERPATEAVAQSPALPAPQAAPPEQSTASITPLLEQSTASINTLKESVAGLESLRKQLSDEVADLKRQLGAAEGERKMLAEQLGSLSSRVDGLAASLASRAESLASEPSKKRAKSH
jgi:septal ring factor EnvC (AmiA/AmiB activator)